MELETILLGLFLGSIGMGYIIYGKKQRRGAALLAGIGLCALPYIITNIFLVLLFGAALMGLPRVARF